MSNLARYQIQNINEEIKRQQEGIERTRTAASEMEKLEESANESK